MFRLPVSRKTHDEIVAGLQAKIDNYAADVGAWERTAANRQAQLIAARAEIAGLRDDVRAAEQAYVQIYPDAQKHRASMAPLLKANADRKARAQGKRGEVEHG